MKKIIALFLAIIFLLSACAAVNPLPASDSPSLSPQPSHAPPPNTSGLTISDFFPMQGNIKMTYQGTGNEFAGFVSTVDYISGNTIQRRTDNTGTTAVTVYTVENGALTKVFSQGETYYRQDYTDKRTMNEVLLKEPITSGTAWTLADGARRSITAVDAAVTVPYGSFTALEVTTENPDSTVREYYAAGVGLIKRVFIPDGEENISVVSELSAYEAGKPSAQSVRFYYPDFNNDRIAYVDQTVEFFTGDTPSPKIEWAFKNPPSGLSRIMSADATINGLKYDPAGGVVTIDFSGTFITKMNAGSGLEGMLLESVADTIGGYYQTGKVRITIDGGPYESGHFLFDTGEYLPYRPDQAVAYAGT